MVQITAVVEGMACGMCEAHVNDAVRKAFPVKKVTSSHSKRRTVILAEEPIPESSIRAAIEATGYTVGPITQEPYEKKGLFGRHK